MRSLRHFFPVLKHLFPRSGQTGHAAHPLDPCASPAWKALYIAALFERDETRAVERIDEAKKAMVVRTRELFHASGDHLRERKAIEETFQSLQALEQVLLPSGHVEAVDWHGKSA
ncbi:MAG TPA: hypothetical protein VLT90_09285 [Terriglobales bacterium]|nr:hypothetical protein [Terriglobales bacterium]